MLWVGNVLLESFGRRFISIRHLGIKPQLGKIISKNLEVARALFLTFLITYITRVQTNFWPVWFFNGSKFPLFILVEFRKHFCPMCFFNFSLVLPVDELIFQWMISGSISVLLIKCELESLFKWWMLASSDKKKAWRCILCIFPPYFPTPSGAWQKFPFV